MQKGPVWGALQSRRGVAESHYRHFSRISSLLFLRCGYEWRWSCARGSSDSPTPGFSGEDRWRPECRLWLLIGVGSCDWSDTWVGVDEWGTKVFSAPSTAPLSAPLRSSEEGKYGFPLSGLSSY